MLGGQQYHRTGRQALDFRQTLDLGVGSVDRVVTAAGNERDSWSFKALVALLFQAHRAEDLGDALRIAKVAVQREGRQLDPRGAKRSRTR